MTALVIEAALNGASSPTVNPHVPVGVEDLVADAFACFEAGASIVHQHDDLRAASAPGPEGMAELSAEMYRAVLARRPHALLYPTANFLASDGIGRWAHHELLASEGLIRLALLDPGSVTYGWADDEGVPARSVVYGYSYEDIAHIVDRCTALRLGPSIAVFEPGYLRVVLAYHRAGRLPPGSFVKLYFGGDRQPFGLPAEPASLEVYLRMMGDVELPWAVAVLGGDVVESGLAEAAIEAGGHVRVGLEDHAGRTTPTNVELVERVTRLAARAGRPVAGCDEAAALLGLP
jgi:uncharacterized protein (DUF849 family)